MKFGSAAFLGAAFLWLAACDMQQGGEPVVRTEIGKGSQEMKAARKAKSPCSVTIFEDVPYTHCVADPAKHAIKTVLGNAEGDPFRSLRAYGESLGEEAVNVAFAVNAGMYGEDGKPIGYYVEDAERLKELNLADGTGNFHMKPNGVFYGTNGKWEIKTSDDFFRTVGDRPRFGTQSGPMLLINGKLHPQFQDDGPSKTVRNGVGIDAEGRAHFVITEGPVSFGQLARYFRDELKIANALYLDGTVSSLWDPLAERIDSGARIGPMIVVTNKEK